MFTDHCSLLHWAFSLQLFENLSPFKNKGRENFVQLLFNENCSLITVIILPRVVGKVMLHLQNQ